MESYVAPRRLWFVVTVDEQPLEIYERRVDADRLREKIGHAASVIPMVPLADLPEPLNTLPRDAYLPMPPMPAEAACEMDSLPESLSQIDEVE